MMFRYSIPLFLNLIILTVASPAPSLRARSVTNDSTLASRDSTPSYCDFGFMSASGGFDYYDQTSELGDGSTSVCFGWGLGTDGNCGAAWSDDDLNDIQTAVDEQVTKDGVFDTSKSGNWVAYFPIETSAFSNRENSFFMIDLLAANNNAIPGDDGTSVGAMTWFWERDGDYLYVTRDPLCCPGTPLC